MPDEGHKGHRSRLRKRYLKAGIESLHDYEIVELLLTYAIPRKDIKPIAKELIYRFDSLPGVMNASFSELLQVEQISENSAILLSIIKDLCSQYLQESLMEQKQLASPADVIDFARVKIGGSDKEMFMIFFLNNHNHFLCHKLLSTGTLDHVVLYPRTVIEFVIETKATNIILVHNHPSGVCRPSSHDLALTSSIQNALNPMGTKLLDHIIVSKDQYYSFSEKALL